MRTCTKCNLEKDESEFYQSGAKIQAKCKKCFNIFAVQRWRDIKIRAIEYKGGECVECGYSSHPAALQFHHVRDKEVNWSKLRLRSWDKITLELDKCILLCANCHNVHHSAYPNS